MARTKEFNEGEVLEKAVNLFNCKGYNGTSARDLVDGLGISRSSLYDTYGDKRALFIKALYRYNEQTTNTTIKFIDSATDVVKTIKQLFQAVIEDAMLDRHKGCFIVNSTIELSTEDKEVAAIIIENMKSVEDALFRVIKRAQESGQMSKENPPRCLARFCLSTISGLRVTAKSGAEKKALEDIVKVAVSALK